MLPDNFASGKRRIKLLVKRLKRQPALLQRYDGIIMGQEKTGIIEPVNDSEIIKPGEVHYIYLIEKLCAMIVQLQRSV